MITYLIGNANLSLDEKGCIASISSVDNSEFSPSSYPAPFLQIGKNKKLCSPVSLSVKEDTLCFCFENDCEVTITCEQKDSYSVFRVFAIKGDIDMLVFGPIFTTLSHSIGDILGIVQSQKYTLGIQALNSKTIGGFPEEYHTYKSDFISNSPVSALSVASLSYFESAGYLAKIANEDCGVLQLYCENRNRMRNRSIMGLSDIVVSPMESSDDSDIVGSSFALFFCDNEKTLDVIGEIEIKEGLPHPMLDGEWLKTSRKAMQSYLIAEFNENNLCSLLEATKRAGFSYLYHPEPFSQWGHFALSAEQFPNGDSSLKSYCEQAKKENVQLGLHTLSSFTTTSDSYVSPIPHKQLAKLGASVLTSPISQTDEVIKIADVAIFKKITTLQTVQIGDELIRYENSNDNQLLGCVRGAFGTVATSHNSNDAVSLLCDHPYRVFFPNMELQESFSNRIASLFNETGAAQISFDGLEGCSATGEDSYGINRFCMDFWNNVNRTDIINDASRLHHNLWHMNTRMNWGEPWGEKMREGMIEYRMRNQDFYHRNLFPRMLGWFLIRKADRKFEATPPEDIEWALSMAAGFDAGFALSTSQAVLETNGCSNELLDTIKNWEELRLADAFSKVPMLREKLRDTKTEWHLEKNSENNFSLYELCLSKPLVCDLLELQPGQPGGSDWIYENRFEEQCYDFRMKVEGNGEIINPSFITSKGILKFQCSIKGGQYLWFRNKKAVITDRNYRILQDVSPIGEGIVQAGQHSFSFSCDFAGEEGPEAVVTIFTKDNGISL